MKKFSPFPCRANDAVLLVQSYQGGKISGQLIHPRSRLPKQIQSIPELILLLDEILLQEDNPVSYHAFESAGFEQLPRIATLHIQVLFQEHHTWQGRIQWEEERKEAAFRSVLELIQILDEILNT